MAIPHEKAGITPKPATHDRFGEIRLETVYHGDHAFLRWRSCQNRRQGLGKFKVETVYLGDFPKKSGSHAKTRDRLGKIQAEPVYHGDRRETRDPIKETIWIGETIRIGETMLQPPPLAIPVEKRRSSPHPPPPSHCLRLDKFAQTTTIRQRGVESLLPPRPSSFWDRRYVHSQFELGSRATDRT